MVLLPCHPFYWEKRPAGILNREWHSLASTYTSYITAWRVTCKCKFLPTNLVKSSLLHLSLSSPPVPIKWDPPPPTQSFPNPLFLEWIDRFRFRLCPGTPKHSNQRERKWESLRHVQLFRTPWTVAWQAPLYLEFSRPEYGVGSCYLLQGIFPSQGSNPGLSYCRCILYCLSNQGGPRILEWVAYPFSSRSSQPRNETRVFFPEGGFLTHWATRGAGNLVKVSAPRLHLSLG